MSTPVIFPLEPLGVLQQLTDFVPHRQLYEIRPDLRIGTHAVATKAISIHPYTSIISIRTWPMFARTGTDRFPIIGIATYFAY
jgi:hypothetical protein